MSYRTAARLRLALSLVLLALSLCVLWAGLDFPLPTAALARRRLQQNTLLTDAQVLASGYVEYGAARSDHFYNFRWYALRSGDRYAVMNAARRSGLFWYPGNLSHRVFSLTEENPVNCSFLEIALFPAFSSTWSVLAVSDLPALARLEAILCWLPSTERETPQPYLEEHGVAVALTETAPGSGVWTAPLTEVPFPSAVNGTSGTSSTWIWCRGYDAAGNLIYESGLEG